jgi:hypothetical protein
MADQGSEIARSLVRRRFPFAEGRRFLHEDDVSHWILRRLSEGL